MVKARAAHMPGEWTRSRSCREGWSKRKYKVGRSFRNPPHLALPAVWFAVPVRRSGRDRGRPVSSAKTRAEKLGLMERCRKKRAVLALEFTR